MSIFNYLFKREESTASIAKERLQIVIAHERATRVDFLPQLQEEILNVISKYIAIDKNQIKMSLDQSGERSVLELNIALPEKQEKREEV